MHMFTKSCYIQNYISINYRSLVDTHKYIYCSNTQWTDNKNMNNSHHFLQLDSSKSWNQHSNKCWLRCRISIFPKDKVVDNNKKGFYNGSQWYCIIGNSDKQFLWMFLSSQISDHHTSLCFCIRLQWHKQLAPFYLGCQMCSKNRQSSMLYQLGYNTALWCTPSSSSKAVSLGRCSLDSCRLLHTCHSRETF